MLVIRDWVSQNPLVLLGDILVPLRKFKRSMWGDIIVALWGCIDSFNDVKALADNFTSIPLRKSTQNYVLVFTLNTTI